MRRSKWQGSVAKAVSPLTGPSDSQTFLRHSSLTESTFRSHPLIHGGGPSQLRGCGVRCTGWERAGALLPLILPRELRSVECDYHTWQAARFPGRVLCTCLASLELVDDQQRSRPLFDCSTAKWEVCNDSLITWGHS